MANIFYYGSDDNVYGPVTESDAQGWYCSGYFSSSIKFQISSSERFDRNKQFFTLGELIEQNGRALPFFISPDTANREKKQEQKLDELTKSHADLLRQLNGLSSQRNDAIPQIEKKFDELKKRVDEQETNLASMKKVLTDVASTCDSNVTKLDRILEKQQEMEGALSGNGKQLAELKEADTLIRNNLNVCEQTVASSSDLLKSLATDLSEIGKELEDQRKLPKVKDWNLICKELCDEDSEDTQAATELQQALTAKETSATSSEEFISELLLILREYCDALVSAEFGSMRSLHLKIRKHDLSQWEINENSTAIRDALKAEIRSITNTPLVCGACEFNVITPRNLLYHFTDFEHVQQAPKVPEQFSEIYATVSDFIASALYKFIASPDEIVQARHLEELLNEQGRQFAMLHPNPIIYRPTPLYMDRIERTAAHTLEIALNEAFPKGSEGFDKRQLSTIASELFAREENHIFPDMMEEYLAEGISFCDSCLAAYASPDEYFQHMTTYSHAVNENNLFSLKMRLWKGNKYWDAMLEDVDH